MFRVPARVLWLVPLVAVCVGGCRSPYYADQGALFGGLTGAGVGALVGDAVGGKALPGAAIGAGVGALSGAVVGNGLDEIEARNRAQIAAQLGRSAPTGAVTISDVVAMTQSGVSDPLMITHIQHNGAAQRLQSADLIYLKNQGVSDGVIQALHTPVARQQLVQPVAAAPVVIEEHYYAPRHPHWHYHHGRYGHRRHHGPRTSFGISVSN